MIIKIGGQAYTLIWMPNSWIEETGTHGQCCRTSLTIKIAEGLPPTRQGETILHEIGHGIHYEYGVYLQKDNDEETLNTLYMSGVYQVLTENPELRDLLFK